MPSILLIVVLIGALVARLEIPVIAACLAAVAGMLSFPETNFLSLLPRSGWNTLPYDNSLLLLQLPPLLVAILLCLRRVAPCRFFAGVAGPLTIGTFSCLCFVTWTPQLQEANRSVPFAGAHTCLASYAKPAEVVMTLPPGYGLYDYAPLYCSTEVYYSHYASRLVADEYEREYRKSVYFSPYLGVLDRPGAPIQKTLAERLREFRLDYILVWKGPLDDRWRLQAAPQWPPLQGQLDVSVQRQLGPFLKVVYEDAD